MRNVEAIAGAATPRSCGSPPERVPRSTLRPYWLGRPRLVVAEIHRPLLPGSLGSCVPRRRSFRLNGALQRVIRWARDLRRGPFRHPRPGSIARREVALVGKVHDRLNRAPLMRFFSPTALAGCAAFASDAASLRTIPLRRFRVSRLPRIASGSRVRESSLRIFASSASAGSAADPLKRALAGSGSCIAVSDRGDVPLPVCRLDAAWPGVLRPGGTHGVHPFAVLLLPRGSVVRLRTSRPTCRSLRHPSRPIFAGRPAA